MKFSLLYLLICLPSVLLFGQTNLVPDPGFDDTIRCLVDSNVARTKLWYSPTMGSPDYLYSTFEVNFSCNPQTIPANRWGGEGFSNSRGYQLPHSGFSYVGLFPGGIEYISIKLNDTLKAGKKYCVSAFSSLGDYSYNAIDLIQFAFTSYPIAVYDTINGFSTYICDSVLADASTPAGYFVVDTANWTFITDTFIAQGGELYMTVGTFDTVQAQYLPVNSMTPIYYCYYYFDDFDVHCLDCSTSVPPSPNIPVISIYPNPSSGNFQLVGSFPSGTKLKIYDMIGRELLEEEIPSGNQTIPVLLDFSEGIYIYRIESEGNLLANGKLEIVK